MIDSLKPDIANSNSIVILQSTNVNWSEKMKMNSFFKWNHSLKYLQTFRLTCKRI